MTLVETLNNCPEKIVIKAESDGGLGMFYQFKFNVFVSKRKVYTGVIKLEDLLEFIDKKLIYFEGTNIYKVPKLKGKE